MKIYIFFFSLLFISCDKGQLKIAIDNKELNYSVHPDSVEFIFKKQKIFRNNDERLSSTNFIKLKIFNSTDKKYLFLLKDFDIINNQNIILNLYENGKKINISTSYIDRKDKGFEYNSMIMACLDYKFTKLNNKAYLLKREGLKNVHQEQNINFFNQSYVIQPYENILFCYSLKFPFLVEDNIEGLFSPKYFFIEKDKKYEFSISYKMEKGLEENLPKEVRKNLKENNIEIFYGEIESNRIPVKNIYLIK